MTNFRLKVMSEPEVLEIYNLKNMKKIENTSRQKSDFFYQRHEYIGAKGYHPHSPIPQIQFSRKSTYPSFVTFLGVTPDSLEIFA